MSTRVRRVAVSGWAQPELVRLAMFGQADHQVWLDAGNNAGQNGVPGRSYLGAGRTRVVTASVERGTVTECILSNGLERTIETTIFEFLRDDIASQVEVSSDERREGDPRAGFCLGWAGWFGYELGAQTVGAPVSRSIVADSPIPEAQDSEPEVADACLIYLDRVIEFDHATQTVFALCFENDGAWAHEVQRLVAAVNLTAHVDERTIESPSIEHPDTVSFRHDQPGYEALIASCLDEIRAGNAYQLCLTNRIEAEFASPLDPFDVYERLRSASPTHHGGLIVSGGVSLVSASPEVFLQVTTDGHATTKPIKGTRPRGVDETHDVALAEELRTNEKERAENLMIVDLMRNDLGRVAQVGTVTVEKLLDVETYSSVHQLVSTVGGDLAPGITAVDALEACFPAGSMTGAPKLSAMRILNGLEAGPRGIYSGAFGYLSLDGACDLAMVIRSIVLHGSRAYIGTGGGITSGSVPAEEWEETLVKARPLLAALGATGQIDSIAGPAGD